MDYLLKPSPLIVAGLTMCVAFATATAVAKLRIKQFLAIPMAGKVVAPCPVMAMPLFLFLCEGALTHGRMPRIASGSDRYRHEDVSRMVDDSGRLVAERQECRNWPIPAQPAAEEPCCKEEIGEEAREGEGSAGNHKGVPHPAEMSIPFPSSRSHDMHWAASIRIASFTAGTSSDGIQQTRA